MWIRGGSVYLEYGIDVGGDIVTRASHYRLGTYSYFVNKLGTVYLPFQTRSTARAEATMEYENTGSISSKTELELIAKVKIDTLPNSLSDTNLVDSAGHVKIRLSPVTWIGGETNSWEFRPAGSGLWVDGGLYVGTGVNIHGVQFWSDLTSYATPDSLIGLYSGQVVRERNPLYNPSGYQITLTGDGTIPGSLNTTPVRQPTIEATTFTICSGGTSTLDAGIYTSYLWSTAATTRTITVSPTTSTTYSLTVTDANALTGSTSATVTVTAARTASISYDPTNFCVNPLVNQEVTPTLTGTAGGIYTINPGVTSINTYSGRIDLQNCVPTIYLITYTLPATTGCPQVTATASIGTGYVPSISIAGSTFINSGTTTTLTATSNYDLRQHICGQQQPPPLQ